MKHLKLFQLKLALIAIGIFSVNQLVISQAIKINSNGNVGINGEPYSS